MQKTLAYYEDSKFYYMVDTDDNTAYVKSKITDKFAILKVGKKMNYTDNPFTDKYYNDFKNKCDGKAVFNVSEHYLTLVKIVKQGTFIRHMFAV